VNPKLLLEATNDNLARLTYSSTSPSHVRIAYAR
jgi:hypothetical protein